MDLDPEWVEAVSQAIDAGLFDDPFDGEDYLESPGTASTQSTDLARNGRQMTLSSALCEFPDVADKGGPSHKQKPKRCKTQQDLD